MGPVALPGLYKSSSGQMTERERPYEPPTADDIRALIKKYWQEYPDPSKRANADNADFLDLKVRATQRRLRDLMRSGLAPHVAERQVIGEVALTD
jgi:hypothetical protein